MCELNNKQQLHSNTSCLKPAKTSHTLAQVDSRSEVILALDERSDQIQDPGKKLDKRP